MNDRLPAWEKDLLFVKLLPSPAEITADSNDAYVAGLWSFYESHRELERILMEYHVLPQWYTKIGLEKGQHVIRALPPVGAEFLIALMPPIAYGLYRALKLYVDRVKGRKVRVKVDGLEIDATGLTQRQFLKLLRCINDQRALPLEDRRNKNKSRRAFAEFKTISPSVGDREETKLPGLYEHTRHEIAQRVAEANTVARAQLGTQISDNAKVGTPKSTGRRHQTSDASDDPNAQ